MKEYTKHKLKYGDIRFLSGSHTKVEVIGYFDSDKPTCRILEALSTSKYNKGEIKRISRRVLYPFDGSKHKFLRKKNE